ncbi:MAG: hypothetical protein DHS20C17_33560 [Cyclobacteriaceae bacterium]|nr:MAG: hypothetical protein DHS20C17_33560 [Cyclobacteriaceae bacterium]
MKQLCLILAISLLSHYLVSQSLSDSVIVYIDNRVELNVAIADYIKLKSSNKVISALDDFQMMLPDLEDQLSLTSAELLRFAVGGSVTIEPGDPKYTYLITDGTLRNTGYRDQAIITGDDFIILITTTDLTKITGFGLTECLQKVIEMLPESARMSKSLHYQCINQEVVPIENLNHTNGRLDFIELGLSAGAGLIKNNWVGDLSFALGLGIVEKGVPKYNPYLSTNLLFGFNDEGNVDLDMFLNIGYRPNIVKDTRKSMFLGLEVGYLIVNQGEIFENTTLKLGANWSPLKGVQVGPQLYFTDNFKTVFPGIRVGFGF